MSLPLHGSLDYSLPFARTGGYRLFIADKMPFQKEINHTIEHGPEENNKPGDYTSMAFYYADKSIATNEVKPTDDLVKVYVPDTLMVYPQLMQYTVGGSVKIDGIFCILLLEHKLKSISARFQRQNINCMQIWKSLQMVAISWFGSVKNN